MTIDNVIPDVIAGLALAVTLMQNFKRDSGELVELRLDAVKAEVAKDYRLELKEALDEIKKEIRDGRTEYVRTGQYDYEHRKVCHELKNQSRQIGLLFQRWNMVMPPDMES